MRGQIPATGIVLAGGRSKRFGSDKSRALLAGRALIEWVAAAVAAVCEDVLVVGGDDPGLPGVRHIVEESPGRGPLGGLAAGLRAARHDRCFATACDVPLLSGAVIRGVLDALGDADAALPVVAGVPQPLAGAYQRDACLASFSVSLEADPPIGPTAALRRLRAVEVPEERLRELDPELLSFMNANTAGVLAELAALVERRANQ